MLFYLSSIFKLFTNNFLPTINRSGKLTEQKEDYEIAIKNLLFILIEVVLECAPIR